VVLSKRERYIAIVSLSVAGILALDRLVYTPLMAQKEEIDMRIDSASEELIGARSLIKTSRDKGRDWAKMSGKGIPQNASQAESQVLNSVREWAQDARLSLSSVKPERTEKEKDYYKITFRATASGTMQQVTRFLYSVQTGSVPARITDVSITSRKEGTDDLTLTLGIATIHPVPESEKPRQPGAPPAPAGATASAAWSHAREVTP